MKDQSRRKFIKNVGVAGLGASLMSSCSLLSEGSSGEKKSPNIIFVFADQHRNHAMGFMGEESVLTPNIDQFAKQSVVMQNAISSYSLCSPYRATMLTGRFPLSTGITTNTKPGLLMELNENEVCLGDVWKQSGYQTCYIGKWHLDAPELTKNAKSASGARDWDAYIPPGPRRHGFDHWYAYNASDHHFTPHYWRDSPEMIKVNEWSPAHETSEAINFIKNRRKDSPFAMIMSWNPPHPPYVAPEEFKAWYNPDQFIVRDNAIGEGENYAKGKKVMLEYYAAISSCDYEFGRLLKTVEEQGLEEDTIIVYAADHGEMLGSHNRMSKNVWYEESINVPFMIRWPGKIEASFKSALFPSYDIMPTLLGIMGLPIPNAVEGTDRSDYLSGRADAKHPDSVLLQRIGVPNDQAPVALGQNPSPYVADAYRLGQEGVDWKQNWYRGIRTKDFTYVVSKGQRHQEITKMLYDNVKDKYQLNPSILSGQKVSEFDNELQMWLDKTGDSFKIIG